MLRCKKLAAALLAAICVLTLAACKDSGNGDNAAAPDLRQCYEAFLSTLGEDNTPAMMNLAEEMDGAYLENYYPGLAAIETNQLVVEAAAISSVPYEITLVEVKNASDVQTVKDILQARVDAQVNGGAFYPATTEAWENAYVADKGNVVALIVAGEEQASAVEAFEKLFS